jgi:hypothetical protein
MAKRPSITAGRVRPLVTVGDGPAASALLWLTEPAYPGLTGAAATQGRVAALDR